MLGIDLSVITYWLNINPNYRLIKQKQRIFTSKRYEAIKAEVNKLLKASFIMEVLHFVWLSKLVLVKKANG